MDQIRYDIRETEKQISSKQEERTSILEQLALTDYEAVKDRLRCLHFVAECISERVSETCDRKNTKDG